MTASTQTRMGLTGMHKVLPLFLLVGCTVASEGGAPHWVYHNGAFRWQGDFPGAS
jgi:hypothetical protein